MNNIIYFPYYTRVIFSIGSLWMLIPIYYSYNNNNVIFNFNLIFNMFFSILYWVFNNHNNLFNYLDKFFSTSTLTIIIYNTDNYIMYLFIPFLYFFIYNGRKLMLNNKYEEHLIIHLIFRYIAFWQCCIYLKHYNFHIFKIYTNIYILSNYILYKIFKNKNIYLIK